MQISFITPTDTTWNKKVINIRGDINVINSFFSSTFSTESVYIDPTPSDLCSALRKHAEKGAGFLRGNPTFDLQDGHRHELIFPDDLTDLIVLDIDGLDGCTPDKKGIDTLLFDWMDLPKCGYVAHFSSSHKIKEGLHCHIFIPLDSPVEYTLLGRGLDKMQVESPLLRERIELDAGGRSLRYPFDPAANRQGAVFAIMQPEYKGMSPVCTPDEAWVVHEGPLLETKVVTEREFPEYLEILRGVKVDLLASIGRSAKAAAGVDKNVIIDGDGWREIADPFPVGSYNIISSPDDGPYVRLNVNEGDSGAYWYHKDDPEWVYCFNGMTKYKMSRFIPELYSTLEHEEDMEGSTDGVPSIVEAQEEAIERKQFDILTTPLKEPVLFSVTGKTGWYVVHPNPKGEVASPYDVAYVDRKEAVLSELHGYKATLNAFRKGKSRVSQVEKVICVPGKSFIQTPYLTPSLYEVGEQRSASETYYNTYVPEKQVEMKAGMEPPHWFIPLVEQTLGDDESIAQVFIQWVAYILQNWESPRTAWIFHGVPGTGKGVLLNVVKKLLSRGFCAQTTFNDSFLAKPSDMYRSKTLLNDRYLTIIEELPMGGMKDRAMDELKSLITDGEYVCRGAYQEGSTAVTQTSFIMTTNHNGALPIGGLDRRFHIPPRQNTRMLDNPAFPEELINRIDRMDENSDDIVLLRSWLTQVVEVSKTAVSKPKMTEYKATMAQSHTNHGETFASVLMGQDHYDWIGTLGGYLDDYDSYVGTLTRNGSASEKDVMNDVMATLLKPFFEGGKRSRTVMTANMIRALYRATVGGISRKNTDLSGPATVKWLNAHKGFIPTEGGKSLPGYLCKSISPGAAEPTATSKTEPVDGVWKIRTNAQFIPALTSQEHGGTIDMKSLAEFVTLARDYGYYHFIDDYDTELWQQKISPLLESYLQNENNYS